LKVLISCLDVRKSVPEEIFGDSDNNHATLLLSFFTAEVLGPDWVRNGKHAYEHVLWTMARFLSSLSQNPEQIVGQMKS